MPLARISRLFPGPDRDETVPAAASASRAMSRATRYANKTVLDLMARLLSNWNESNHLHPILAVQSREDTAITEKTLRRMKSVNSMPLHRQVIEALSEYLEAGGVPDDNRLPSENVLAAQIGVSRLTIRETLLAMEREGYLTKKHGVGTFVHPSALRAKTRIEQVVGFSELLSQGGHNRVKVIGHRYTGVANECAALLGIQPDAILLCYRRTFLVDEQPAIYTTIRIPETIIGKEMTVSGDNESVFSLVKRASGEEITHRVAWLKARKVDEEVGEALAMPVGEPVLSWDSVLYNYRDRPLAQSSVFFNTDVIPICTVGMTVVADRSST